MRRDSFVQITLPVEALGDGLDHEVAFAEARKVGAIVAGVDGGCAILGTQRRGFELGQRTDRLAHQRVRVAVLGRKVEQQHRDVGIGQVCRDLGTHDAGPENGNLADDQR